MDDAETSTYFLQEECGPPTIPATYCLKIGCNTVGRLPNSDINVTSVQCSRNHSVITVQPDDVVVIQDLKSLNGTFVNYVLIDGETRIQPNDVIGIGCPGTIDNVIRGERNIFQLKSRNKPYDPGISTPMPTKIISTSATPTSNPQAEHVQQQLIRCTHTTNKVPQRDPPNVQTDHGQKTNIDVVIDSDSELQSYPSYPFDRNCWSRKPIRPHNGNNHARVSSPLIPLREDNDLNTPTATKKRLETVPYTPTPQRVIVPSVQPPAPTERRHKKSMRPGPSTDLSRNVDDDQNFGITADDTTLLQTGGWLTDGILSFYGQHLCSIDKNKNILFVPSSITACLKFSEVNQWDQFLQSDSKLKSLLLFPLTDAAGPELPGTHWVLITYSIADATCRYFDSKYHVQNYQSYGIEDFCKKIVEYMDGPKITITVMNCLRQNNHNDCGIHTLLNAEHIINSFVANNSCTAPPTFSHDKVSLTRKEIYELIQSNQREAELKSKASKPTRAPLDRLKDVRKTDADEDVKTPRVTKQLDAANTRKKPAGKTTAFKRVKEVRPEDQPSQVNFTTVKLKLLTILEDKKDNMRDLISNLSIKATRISSLASMLLLAKVNNFLARNDFFQLKPNKVVEDCFFEVLNPEKHVQGRVRTAAYPKFILPRFLTEMAAQKIVLPDNNGMGNIFKYLHQSYASNFKTNITTHARHRIEQFFKTFTDITTRTRKSTVEYLFFAQSRRQPSQFLIDQLRNLDRRYEDFSKGSLAPLDKKNNWFWYVPLFIRIQRHVNAYNMRWAEEWRNEDEQQKQKRKKKDKNQKRNCDDDFKKPTHTRVRPMRIVPLCKYKRQHIRIDTEGLYRLVAGMKLLPKQSQNRDINQIQFAQRFEEFWNQYFAMDKILGIANKSKNKTEFHYQIHTDGESVSVLYKSPLKVEVDTEIRLQRIRDNYKNKQYKYEVGIDVGYNTYIAAIRRTAETGKEVLTKIKSKMFHRNTRNNVRKKKFQRLAGFYENQAALDRESYPNIPSPSSTNYWNYIQHRLRFWADGITTYTPATYAKMSFDKYSRTQTSIDNIVSKLTNRSPSLLFIGGAEFTSNSPIKGHVRCPGIRKVVKALRKHSTSDHVFVDEYNTSQHCGICISHFDPSTKAARFKNCRSCTPSPLTQPATIVVTNKSKRLLQLQRRNARIENEEPIPISISKIIKWHKSQSDPNPKTTIWQRDISASRLIWYKGLCALRHDGIDLRLMRPSVNPINYDDDNEFRTLNTLPPSTIW